MKHFAVIALSAVLGVASAVVYAGPVETETTHEHQATLSYTEPVGCSGDLYDITVTYNRVDHSTINNDGTVHFTFTETGKFEADPHDGTGPSYSGSYTHWGDFNANNSTFGGTSTFSVRGEGSDGSRVNIHIVGHFNVTPPGVVHEFFNSTCD